MAELIPEELPPVSDVGPGEVRDALIAIFGDRTGDELFEWMAIRYPAWARIGWERAEAGQAWCRERGL